MLVRGLVALVVIAALAGAFFWTESMGHADAKKAAQQANLCEDDQCAQGMSALYQVVSEQYGLNPATVDWCLGTDEWAQARVVRGGFLRDIAVYFMYMPCGKLAEDDHGLKPAVMCLGSWRVSGNRTGRQIWITYRLQHHW